MKLIPCGKFINGGFVATMSIKADVAIAILKEKIQFNDEIMPVCLPNDNTLETGYFRGCFSGWNAKRKKIKSINATTAKIGDVERFVISVGSGFVDAKSGELRKFLV